METFETQGLLWKELEVPTSLPAEIHALVEARPQTVRQVNTPTSPDTSLPWSQDYAHDGWSARMFLHQMISGLSPHWNCSDTDALSSELTPKRIRLKDGRGILLSDVINREESTRFDLSSHAIAYMVKRSIKRQVGFHVLLLDTTGVKQVALSFGKGAQDFESCRVKNFHGLPDSQLDGLRDYLIQQLRDLQETQ